MLNQKNKNKKKGWEEKRWKYIFCWERERERENKVYIYIAFAKREEREKIMRIRNGERGGGDAMAVSRSWVKKKMKMDFCKEKGREKKGEWVFRER